VNDVFQRNVCVAHDIKGLVTRARLAVDLLGRHEDEPVRRQAERIARALEKMLQICLEEFSVPQDNALPERIDAQDLTNLLHEVFAIVRAKSEHPLRMPHLSVHSDVHVTVDAHALLRILNHLVRGASASWGDTGETAMVLRVSQRKDKVVFELARALDQRISQDATQSDLSQIGRIGAGLISAMRLAQELGGNVFMLNTQNQPPAFCLQLPADPVQQVSALLLNTTSGASDVRAALHPAE